MTDLTLKDILDIRKVLPKPIHTLWISPSVYRRLKELFYSGQQLGLGSIRLVESSLLPDNLAIGERSDNTLVVIKFGGVYNETSHQHDDVQR